MAALPGEYEDGGDEEFSRPLPPEDRLWRHPSELGGGQFSMHLDPTLVRNRWLSSQPSRASAWTAGLVGAFLATGLVVLGTHLVTALNGTPAPDAPITLTSLAPESFTNSATPSAGGLGAAQLTSVESVGASVVTIEVAGATNRTLLGVVLAGDGTILTSAAGLAGATSVLAHLPGDEVLPALAVSDSRSGLAVLRLNGVSGLPAAHLAPLPVVAGSLAIAVTAAGGTSYATAEVSATDVQPTLTSGGLVDAMATDLSATEAPAGSPLLDAQGQVVGIVVGASAGHAVAVPSWLALPVAQQLMASGAVDRGWLGIQVAPSVKHLAGVLVTSVPPASAGAQAGILPGDLITTLNGKPLNSMTALIGALYVFRPGEVVVLGVERASHHLIYRATLESYP